MSHEERAATAVQPDDQPKPRRGDAAMTLVERRIERHEARLTEIEVDRESAVEKLEAHYDGKKQHFERLIAGDRELLASMEEQKAKLDALRQDARRRTERRP